MHPAVGATLELEHYALPVLSWKRTGMSKENALSFFQRAATDPDLKSQVQEIDQPAELVSLAEDQGYAFSPDNVREVLPELTAQKGFFGDLVEAILELFGPTHDDYPATGVQPFSGDPQPKH